MIELVHAIIGSITVVLIAGAFFLGKRYGQWTIHREKAARSSAEGKLEQSLQLVEQLNAKVRELERNWMNAQDAVEVFQQQRDEWLDRCKQQALLHLSGQQQLETNIVAARTMFQRAVQQWNAERKRAGAPAVELKMAELLAPPVGEAAEYFERIKALLLSAPETFDAAIASRRVNEADFDDALARAIVAVRIADKRPAQGLPPQASHIAPKLEAS